MLFTVLIDIDNRARELMTNMTTQTFFVLGRAENLRWCRCQRCGRWARAASCMARGCSPKTALSGAKSRWRDQPQLPRRRLPAVWRGRDADCRDGRPLLGKTGGGKKKNPSAGHARPPGRREARCERALIELAAVSRCYPNGDSEVRALDEVSLRIAQGEFIALLGRPAAASPR